MVRDQHQSQAISGDIVIEFEGDKVASWKFISNPTTELWSAISPDGERREGFTPEKLLELMRHALSATTFPN